MEDNDILKLETGLIYALAVYTQNDYVVKQRVSPILSLVGRAVGLPNEYFNIIRDLSLYNPKTKKIEKKVTSSTKLKFGIKRQRIVEPIGVSQDIVSTSAQVVTSIAPYLLKFVTYTYSHWLKPIKNQDGTINKRQLGLRIGLITALILSYLAVLQSLDDAKTEIAKVQSQIESSEGHLFHLQRGILHATVGKEQFDKFKSALTATAYYTGGGLESLFGTVKTAGGYMGLNIPELPQVVNSALQHLDKLTLPELLAGLENGRRYLEGLTDDVLGQTITMSAATFYSGLNINQYIRDKASAVTSKLSRFLPRVFTATSTKIVHTYQSVTEAVQKKVVGNSQVASALANGLSSLSMVVATSTLMVVGTEAAVSYLKSGIGYSQDRVKYIKAGKYKNHQLYRLPKSKSKFYLYKSKSGKMSKRYISK